MATAPAPKAPVKEVDDTPKPVRVYTFANDRRVLFEGTLDDARTFVERNFPAPHIEPGVWTDDIRPDAFIASGDSDLTYDGKKWSDE